jgi:TonB family protein
MPRPFPLLLLLSAATALAAEPTLPVVVQEVPPVYPADALAAGAEAVVALGVDISETGAVVGAEIVAPPPGPFAEEFDVAALEAIRSFRFTPARDASGEPIASRIEYVLQFVPTQAAALSMEGEARIGGTRDPLPGATVRVTGPSGAERTVATDSDGKWSFAGLEPGTWQVLVRAPGFDDETATVDVAAGTVASVRVFPTEARPWEARADLEIEVLGTRPQAEVTQRPIGRDEIHYLPGTNGDVVKVLQNLPGVARSPLGIGQLLIRGTAPEDSSYFLDGSEIPIVFHFGGFSTVVNGDELQEVTLLPGNYGVRYGRQLGGVVELVTREALPEKSRAYVSIDLFQATAFLDQEVGSRDALTFSFRRSYVDAILNPVFGAIGLENIRAPRYYDGQICWQHQLANGGKLSAMVLGSDDGFRILGNDAGSVDFGLGISFLKGEVRYTRTFADGWTSETSGIFGPESMTFAVGASSEAYEKPLTGGFRQEWRREAPVDGLGWRAGIDLEGGKFAYEYDVVGFGLPAGEDGSVDWFAPGVYGESTLRTGHLSFTPGVRLDGWIVDQGTELGALDPRMSLRYDVSPDLTLKAGLGKYSQFPEFRQIDVDTGSPGLRPSDALQTSAGFEWAFRPDWSLGITAFHDSLRSLVVGREDAFAFFTGPPPAGPLDTAPYANRGLGESDGVELMAKVETDRTIGWLAGTFQRSTRTDRFGNTGLFAYDQPIVLTALASRELPKRWRLGGRFRFGSGDPYTPVVNRIWELDTREWVPIFGDLTGSRLPPFWQLDARFDKDWVFRRWTLTFYLDLQNATSHQNVEVISWTRDYSREQPIIGLPVVPAFGLKGEW